LQHAEHNGEGIFNFWNYASRFAFREPYMLKMSVLFHVDDSKISQKLETSKENDDWSWKNQALRGYKSQIKKILMSEKNTSSLIG
jgi:hypothetical protein